MNKKIHEQVLKEVMNNQDWNDIASSENTVKKAISRTIELMEEDSKDWKSVINQYRKEIKLIYKNQKEKVKEIKLKHKKEISDLRTYIKSREEELEFKHKDSINVIGRCDYCNKDNAISEKGDKKECFNCSLKQQKADFRKMIEKLIVECPLDVIYNDDYEKGFMKGMMNTKREILAKLGDDYNSQQEEDSLKGIALAKKSAVVNPADTCICGQHKIKKEIDLGGVLFCKICLDEGAEKINKFLKSKKFQGVEK